MKKLQRFMQELCDISSRKREEQRTKYRFAIKTAVKDDRRRGWKTKQSFATCCMGERSWQTEWRDVYAALLASRPKSEESRRRTSRRQPLASESSRGGEEARR